MPRRDRKLRWYNWIIRNRSDQERDMNDHTDRLSEAQRAKRDAETRYRNLVERGGAVHKVTTESGALARRNHFSETIESLLREGARRRAQGQ